MSATLPPSLSALPDRWVERIFSHMACHYGNRFADMWSGQDTETVKAFWARKLGGFADMPEVIGWALDALDDQPTPPSLPQFIAMCRIASKRRPGMVALPPPAIDKVRAAEILAEARRRFSV